MMSESDDPLRLDDEVLNLMGSSITVKNVQDLLALVTESKQQERKGAVLEDLMEDYFETESYATTATHYEDFESSVMRLCAYEVIKRDFEIDECWFVKERDYDAVARKLPPLFDNFTVKDSMNFIETKHAVPRKVTFFCRRKRDNSKWVFHFNTWEDMVCEFMVATQKTHQSMKKVLDDIDTDFAEDGPMKGGCFNPNWGWVDLEKSDWSALVLPDEIMESLNLNIVNFLKNLDLYEEHGLSTSRGVLLAGPPGTGKTLTMEVLLNEFREMTRIYAPAETLIRPGVINETYELARKLSPSLILIEDIDTLGQAEDHQDRNLYVSQLLSSLNSVESNKGVITVASTNYPQALDIALRDRPGRFDARVEFPMPNKGGREKILLKYSKPFKTDKVIEWEKWANKTDKFSGAWLRELVTTAFSLAVQDRKGNSAPVLSESHMKQAFVIVQEAREKANALHSGQSENLYQ